MYPQSVILTEYEKSATLELTDGDKKMKNNIRSDKKNHNWARTDSLSTSNVFFMLVIYLFCSVY